MTRIHPFVLLVLLTTFTVSQAQSSFEDRAIIRNETPVNGEVFSELGISEISFSQIATGLDQSELFFGRGRWKNKSIVWTRSIFAGVDQGFQIQSYAKQQSPNRLFQSDVKLFADQNIVFPLEVRFTEGSDQLEYRWVLNDISISKGAKAGGSAPGFDLSEGNILPSVVVETLEGNDVDLAQYRGKILVINWWSTSCGPCIKEMPELNRLKASYLEDSDIVFLAIAWDRIHILEKFLRRKDFQYEQTWFKSTDTFALFGNAFPVHLVIDQEGDISLFQEGFHPGIVRQMDLVIKELKAS